MSFIAELFGHVTLEYVTSVVCITFLEAHLI